MERFHTLSSRNGMFATDVDHRDVQPQQLLGGTYWRDLSLESSGPRRIFPVLTAGPVKKNGR
jgi:hypothetical protein